MNSIAHNNGRAQSVRAIATSLPHNLDAEASILGGVILDNAQLASLPQLEPSDFYAPQHRIVFAGMRNLEAAGAPIDVVTLEAEIERAGKLDAVGGIAFLGELALRVPTADNVVAYVAIVRDAAYKRGLSIILDQIARCAARGDDDPDEYSADAIRQIEQFNERYREVLKRSDGAPRYGRPFIEFVGDEPDDNPADVFEAHGLIVRGEPSLFIGDPKVGKTFLVEDLMLHLAAGRKEWCGVRLNRRCRVLLFLREDSVRTTRRRLHQLARGATIELWELADHLDIDATSALYLDDPSHVARLKSQLGDYDICAIDSLSTVHNADENSVERMAPIMNRWRDLSLETSTAIPIVHHFRKGTGDAPATGTGVLQRARGSSLIGATTRHAVGIERGPSEHQVVVSVESNHEIDVEPFVIVRRFGADDEGRKYVRHERAGSLQNARASQESALLDPIVLAVVAASPDIGIGSRDLRDAAIGRVKDKRGTGVRPARVDAAAIRLETAGRITRIHGGNWKAVTP